MLLGQERGNVALVERSGTGCYAPDADALVRAVTVGSCARPTFDTSQALWWGSAAQRVAAHLVAAGAGPTVTSGYAFSSTRANAPI